MHSLPNVSVVPIHCQLPKVALVIILLLTCRKHEKMVVGIELFITAFLNGNYRKEITAGKQAIENTDG